MDVGLATRGRERRPAPLHRRVRRRLVLALGERMQRCPQHPVEQQVARRAIEVPGAVHPIFELDVDRHSEPARGGGRDAHQVRLHRAGDQHRVRAPRPRLAEVELELAHLVAAQGEPRAVVALDPELDPERRAQVGRGLQRRRHVAEPDPRKAGDAGKGAGHGGRGPSVLLHRSPCGSRIAARQVPSPSGDCKRFQAERPLFGGTGRTGSGFHRLVRSAAPLLDRQDSPCC